MQYFLVIIMTLATLVSADVSHLDNYNYRVPEAFKLIPLKSKSQLQTFANIESIRASVPVSSFSLQQNIGQQQNFDSQSYSSAQSLNAYTNYNIPDHNVPAAFAVQNTYLPPENQQQQYSAAVPLHQPSYFAPAGLGPFRNTYLPPAPQEQYSAPASVDHQLTYSAAPNAPIQHIFNFPAAVPEQNPYLPPVPEPQYSAPSHAQQQSFSTPEKILQQSYSAPVQQSYSTTVPVQEHSYFSAGQSQQQSYEVTEHQQQSFGSIEARSAEDNGAYNNQARVQQQSGFVSDPTAVHQNFITPLSTTFQHSSTFQQQSHLPTAVIQNGCYNDQPSYPAPAHHTVTNSVGVESGSYKYQPATHLQPHYNSAQAQQSHSTAVTSMQQSSAVSFGTESGSYNYQPATPVQAAVAVQKIRSTLVSAPQIVEYSASSLQKPTIQLPPTTLDAPVKIPEIGTAYGKNCGYIYRKR